MKKILYLSYFFVLPAFAAFAWSGCGREAELLSVGSSQEIQPLTKNTAAPGLQVTPVFRMPTGKNGQRLTVFVFYEKGGNGGGGGKKPPKDDGGGEVCSDPNTNKAFSELGVRWAQTGIWVDYQPAFEPDAVTGMAYGAIDRAFDAWELAMLNGSLVEVVEDASAPLPPASDGRNVVGWRQLVGRDSRKVLAATYIWDVDGMISEVDIVYNTAHKWAVNEAILDGSTTCGKDFDVQAIGVHEIGHLLGLGHVYDDGVMENGDETDATMAPTAAKGELKKQTLTPGDMAGVKAVLQLAI